MQFSIMLSTYLTFAPWHLWSSRRDFLPLISKFGKESPPPPPNKGKLVEVTIFRKIQKFPNCFSRISNVIFNYVKHILHYLSLASFGFLMRFSSFDTQIRVPASSARTSTFPSPPPKQRACGKGNSRVGGRPRWVLQVPDIRRTSGDAGLIDSTPTI